MKTLLKICLGLVLFLMLCTSVLYVWASHKDAVLLARVVPTHRVDFPIPFPLSSDEVAAIREQRGDPLAGTDLDAIASARAVERGDHLVHARYACVECHGQDFGGGVMVDEPLIGRILGPNITAGTGGRTAAYTASDWDRIVRHGIRPDGLPAAMPSEDFQDMSDQELSDIVMYIRSSRPVNSAVPPMHLGPLGKVLLALGQLPLSVDLIKDHMSAHPKYPPAAEPTEAFGRHLAGTCTGCHRADLAGGVIVGGDPSWAPAANLTSHPDGIAGWTYEQFAAVLRTGKKPDGTDVRVPMSLVTPYGQKMTDVELQALWAYIQSVPPVASKK